MKTANILKNYCHVTNENLYKAIESGGFLGHILNAVTLDDRIKAVVSEIFGIKFIGKNPACIIIFKDFSSIIVARGDAPHIHEVYVIDDLDEALNNRFSKAIKNEAK